MAMRKTRKMTSKYWNSLSEGSRRRALQYVFPMHKTIVDMLVGERPNKVTERGSWWWMVFRDVRIPEDGSFYKTVICNRAHNTYLM